jgi:hypothetical protein
MGRFERKTDAEGNRLYLFFGVRCRVRVCGLECDIPRGFRVRAPSDFRRQQLRPVPRRRLRDRCAGRGVAVPGANPADTARWIPSRCEPEYIFRFHLASQRRLDEVLSQSETDDERRDGMPVFSSGFTRSDDPRSFSRIHKVRDVGNGEQPAPDRYLIRS